MAMLITQTEVCLFFFFSSWIVSLIMEVKFQGERYT